MAVAVCGESMSFKLREMVVADVDTIMDIEVKAHAWPWTHGIFKDNIESGYNCWVMEENSEIVAYGIVQIVVGESELLNITVNPKHQGKGYGRLMLNELIDIARAGADTMFLEVRPSNKNAIGLYESMGFNEIGVRKNYYPAKGGREDALMMALAL